jgi:hypothetical protein
MVVIRAMHGNGVPSTRNPEHKARTWGTNELTPVCKLFSQRFFKGRLV